MSAVSSMAGLQPISEAPRIYKVDDFATPDELANTLERAADADRLRDEGIQTKHDHTGFSFEMPVAGDTLLESLTERTYQLLGVDNDYGHSLRFRRYRVGESHPPHLDAFEIDDKHLIATALLYLNDTEAGGETYFADAAPSPVSVAPRAGRLVVWLNHKPDGAVDQTSRHASLPVTAGSKSTLANFIYKPLSACALFDGLLSRSPIMGFRGKTP